MIYNGIGNYLSACRKKQNITQKELAEKLKVSPQTVSNWERELYLPDVSLIMPLSMALGIEVHELLKRV